MGKTFKTDRARNSRLATKEFGRAYGGALRDIKEETGKDFLDSEDYSYANEAAERHLHSKGLKKRGYHDYDEDYETGGVRYGNQRKMRSRSDVKARRAEKRNMVDPMLDAEGDFELEDRPHSPAKSRGPRWT